MNHPLAEARRSFASRLLSSLSVVSLFTIALVSQGVAQCTLNPASPSVTICTPANGATVSSPVQVTAGTTDKAHPVTAMTLYVDNASFYKVKASQLSTSVTLAKGKHNLTVNAWDSSGAVFKTTVIVTSTGTGVSPVSVAVSPNAVTLAEGATQQFAATVLNTSNTAVTWKVDGVLNGNATVGTISSAGLYVAPAATGTHTVLATSVADPTKTDQAAVTVTGPSNGCTPTGSAPSITICSPSNGSTVSNPVHVQATGISNSTISSFLLYTNNQIAYQGKGSSLDASVTLPNGTNHLVFQFYSNGAWTKASESVIVSAGVQISVSPATASIAPGETQQLVATVTGAADTTATWTVDGTPGGNDSVGTISTTGLYTAPSAPGTHTVTATSTADPTKSAHSMITVQAAGTPGVVPVLTYHLDQARTGANTNESVLNTTNVNQATFGKKYVYPVDGQMYAQPLYMPNLTINGGTHNVVFVATENDTVYAFDADGRQSTALWQVSVGPAVNVGASTGIAPMIGVTSTPVIDSSTGTMYVLATTSNGSRFKLHALDITTGAEKFGGPVAVTASVAGTGADSNNGVLNLEGGCYQRAGLAQANGQIYIAFGHCGHGWMLSYDQTSLQQTGVFNTTPNSSGGTFWMSGGAPGIDPSGYLYVMTGTNFGSSQPGYNDAFIQLTPQDTFNDFFIPSNNDYLITNDVDLGSGGLVVMPDNSGTHPHTVIGGGKDGRLFVIDRDNMGGFGVTDNVVQAVQTGTSQNNNLHCTPVYWNGYIYVNSSKDVARQFSWSQSTGMLSTSPVSQSSVTVNGHGATPFISSNGTSEGILWLIDSSAYSTGGPAVLHAFNAMDLSKELYNSSQAGTRDQAGSAIKFTPPIVTDGKVFVSTSNELDIYGPL